MVSTFNTAYGSTGKVANPAWSAEQGKMTFSLSLLAPENLVSRDRFGRPYPCQPAHFHTRTQSGPDSRDSFRFLRRPPHITSTAIGLVVSLPGDTTAYRRYLLPRVHWRRSSSPFPTPTILLILLLVCSCCCW